MSDMDRLNNPKLATGTSVLLTDRREYWNEQ